MTRIEHDEACREARKLLEISGFPCTPDEPGSIVAADFGLGRLRSEGLQILTLFETRHIGAKVLILLPGQVMVEHWHPVRETDGGKEETIRCLWGLCHVMVPGVDNIRGDGIPAGRGDYYTCRHGIALRPGAQIVIPSGVKHWFRSGADGCAALSLSSRVTDLDDRFTDPSVVRVSRIEE